MVQEPPCFGEIANSIELLRNWKSGSASGRHHRRAAWSPCGGESRGESGRGGMRRCCSSSRRPLLFARVHPHAALSSRCSALSVYSARIQHSFVPPCPRAALRRRDAQYRGISLKRYGRRDVFPFGRLMVCTFAIQDFPRSRHIEALGSRRSQLIMPEPS